MDTSASGTPEPSDIPETSHDAQPGERDLEEALDPGGAPATDEVSERVAPSLKEVREELARHPGQSLPEKESEAD